MSDGLWWMVPKKTKKKNHIINNVLSAMYVCSMYKYRIIYQGMMGSILFGSISFILFHNQHSYNPPYVPAVRLIGDVYGIRDAAYVFPEAVKTPVN